MTWMYLVFGFLGLAMFLPTIDMEISNDNADINGDDQDNRLSGSEISDTIRVAMAMTNCMAALEMTNVTAIILTGQRVTATAKTPCTAVPEMIYYEEV